MSELKPCPFCGSDSARAIDGGKQVWCSDCYADGPFTEEHIAAWNRRAAGWVSVAERLPEDDRQVLCYNGSYRFVGFLSNRKNIGWINTSKLQEASCTHWMPLPEPPEVK